jgi:hypothetical protein
MTTPMRRALLVALAIASPAAFAQAAAAPNPAPASAVAPPPAVDPPLEFEAGRTAAQYIGGVLVAAVPFMGLEDPDTALVVLAATPALVGGATCLIGRAGQHDGACWATILGAYLGAATVYPLAYLGYRNDDTSGGPGGEQYYGNAILGAAIGWFLVQPLGATLGWHFSRSPRRTISAGLPPRTAPRLLQPPRRREPHALRSATVAPLLSLRF